MDYMEGAAREFAAREGRTMLNEMDRSYARRALRPVLAEVDRLRAEHVKTLELLARECGREHRLRKAMSAAIGVLAHGDTGDAARVILAEALDA